MAGHKVTIQPAAEDELTNIFEWYLAAGVNDPSGDPPELLNRLFADAERSKILGAALGRELTDAMLIGEQSSPADAMLTRTLALSMRLDGETIGMLVMGPSPKVINRITENLPKEIMQNAEAVQTIFYILLLRMAKLQMIAIDPIHGGRGHGARLVRHALEVARKSGIEKIFGEYRQDRTHLAKFYSGLGFDVLETGGLMEFEILPNFSCAIHAENGDVMFARDI